MNGICGKAEASEADSHKRTDVVDVSLRAADAGKVRLKEKCDALSVVMEKTRTIFFQCLSYDDATTMLQ